MNEGGRWLPLRQMVEEGAVLLTEEERLGLLVELTDRLGEVLRLTRENPGMWEQAKLLLADIEAMMPGHEEDEGSGAEVMVRVTGEEKSTITGIGYGWGDVEPDIETAVRFDNGVEMGRSVVAGAAVIEATGADVASESVEVSDGETVEELLGEEVVVDEGWPSEADLPPMAWAEMIKEVSLEELREWLEKGPQESIQDFNKRVGMGVKAARLAFRWLESQAGDGDSPVAGLLMVGEGEEPLVRRHYRRGKSGNDKFGPWARVNFEVLALKMDGMMAGCRKAGEIYGEAMKRVVVGYYARQRMEQENEALVVQCLSRSGFLGRGHDEALINEGISGLLRGIDRYDPERGTELSTYVWMWIWQAAASYFSEQRLFSITPQTRLALFRAYRQTQELVDSDAGWKWNEAFNYAVEQEAEASGVSVKLLLQAHRLVEVNMSFDDPMGGDYGDDTLGEMVEDGKPSVLDQVARRLLEEQLEDALATVRNQMYVDMVRWRYGLMDGRTRTLEEVGQMYGRTRELVRLAEKKVFAAIRLVSERSLRDFLDDLE